jgi:hypothetical protein
MVADIRFVGLRGKDIKALEKVYDDIDKKLAEGAELTSKELARGVWAKARELVPKHTNRLFSFIRLQPGSNKKREYNVLSMNPTKNYPKGYRGEGNRGDGFNLALWFATSSRAKSRTGNVDYMKRAASHGRKISDATVRQSLTKVFVKKKKIV